MIFKCQLVNQKSLGIPVPQWDYNLEISWGTWKSVIKTKKSSGDSDMQPDVRNTTQSPLISAKHLKILGEFLMKKGAEWCEIKITPKLWVSIKSHDESIISREK